MDAFNTTWSALGYTTTINQMPVTVGFGNKHYIRLTDSGFVGFADSNGVVRPGPLKSRPEPLSPPIGDTDYDSSLNGNFLSTEVLPRKNVVYRGGDTMTGPLYLNDHPAPLTGFGSPNGTSDLEAATKFYVDNNTYASNVNLYVSTASGDDLQSKTPVGKEGRFWQFAYKTIGAAALQAENLINLASQEPGPYKQRISYTIGPDQTFSTIQSVTLQGGKTGVTGYQDAFDLLEANKEFIQEETIAYINKKYVNSFVYDKPSLASDMQNIVDAIGNDLLTKGTYNSYRIASHYIDAANNGELIGSLVQTIDAVTYLKNQILGYYYDDVKLKAYIGFLIDAICYDFVFNSNYQTVQAGLAFASAGTNITTSELSKLLDTSVTDITSVIGDGIRATFSFSTQLQAPYAVGDTIIISGMNPVEYNGTYTILSATVSNITVTNTTTATPIEYGTIVRNNLATGLLSITEVSNSVTITNSIKNSLNLLTDIASTEIGRAHV